MHYTNQSAVYPTFLPATNLSLESLATKLRKSWRTAHIHESTTAGKRLKFPTERSPTSKGMWCSAGSSRRAPTLALSKRVLSHLFRVTTPKSTIAYLYSPTLVKLILTRLLVMGFPAVSRLHGITLVELYEHDTKAILIQTPTGSEGSRRLKLPGFSVGTWGWKGCLPYAPAALTPRKDPWYSFLLQAESTPKQ
jgi:hypothetical protein